MQIEDSHVTNSAFIFESREGSLAGRMAMMSRVLTPNEFNAHVDRTEEFRIFGRLLSGEHPDHMLLIQAGPGMGKSALLERFYSQSEQYPRALVDLRRLDCTPAEFLGELASQLETTIKGLGGGAAFQRYHEQRERLFQPGDITIQASRLTRVNLTASWDMRSSEQAALQIITDAFFSDLDGFLEEYPRIILLIDTFEKANIEVERWVKGLFLNRIRGRHRIVVVLAGQKIPELGPASATWQLKPLELCDVRDYLNRVELSLSEEQINVLYALTEGIPLDLRMGVTRLSLRKEKGS